MKHSIISTTTQKVGQDCLTQRSDYAAMTAFDTRKYAGRGILQIRIDSDGWDEKDRPVELPEQTVSVNLMDEKGHKFEGTITEFKALIIAGMKAVQKSQTKTDKNVSV